MHKPIAIFLCTIFLVIASSCTTDSSPGSVSGHAIDWWDGAPLQKATLTLMPEGKVTTSDSSGYFQFGDVAPGSHYIQAEKQDFIYDSTELFTLAGGESKEIIAKVTSMIGGWNFAQGGNSGPHGFITFNRDNTVDPIFYGPCTWRLLHDSLKIIDTSGMVLIAGKVKHVWITGHIHWRNDTTGVWTDIPWNGTRL